MPNHIFTGFKHLNNLEIRLTDNKLFVLALHGYNLEAFKKKKKIKYAILHMICWSKVFGDYKTQSEDLWLFCCYGCFLVWIHLKIVFSSENLSPSVATAKGKNKCPFLRILLHKYITLPSNYWSHITTFLSCWLFQKFPFDLCLNR